MSDGFRSYKENSIFAVAIATSQRNKNWWIHFMYACCYVEKALKILDKSQQVVSEVKCVSH